MKQMHLKASDLNMAMSFRFIIQYLFLFVLHVHRQSSQLQFCPTLLKHHGLCECPFLSKLQYLHPPVAGKSDFICTLVLISKHIISWKNGSSKKKQSDFSYVKSTPTSKYISEIPILVCKAIGLLCSDEISQAQHKNSQTN